MIPPAGAGPLRRELPTVADTEAFGEELGRELAAGDLLLLAGPLGAGKTALVRGLARGLGVTGSVASPTFVIAREHPSSGGGPALVHVDAYRLGGPDGNVGVAAELDDLDLDTELGRAVVAVEWGGGLAERLAGDDERGAVEVVLERRDDETRVATLRRTARP
ncbi:TsaE protein, required for threonylcarbamoyladenosine t(6)A37 formation in tRNA [Pseudonocardia sp. Ae168_Ps1]|uniref:tRNA (adenosine(37)-N6)-threonylcarbamoyltransferase complex ATPase subunit type 1 TsaE n=1 Tax=unclassified Pseudonocardia TaxID=2619320 RepID=UPI00094B5B7E|nr:MULTISPECIES: tRNA (adenosine(37)-N6)-threonylcarbamoyltransferase complex ATPase subunit type 1 TsaE [unclassified Pseudonocardia]OLL74085.1 TsaE protein, required for threonylcarbamoyladenosine t(6)A37 formation in tRNA [Pseudonocardia sp. Ae150A_Ps1]OLL80063.1 TsaE protein, required for threonylcarbamoyladenosine t(6)A37 formation in tRNA [Pseudonocardia sp. Ae168_Ps1]OLL85805.1 TsaE protein, required for threonylcarbamoyladenosine t(6)A37 formation in tRNA [Pseudonocardia sp. Ae263_Ps1]O